MTEDTSDPQVRVWFNANAITEAECLVPDLTGEPKGKIMPAARYLDGERPRLPDTIFIQTATGDYPDDDEEITDPAELDMQLTADLSTCRLVPWAREPTAQVIHKCHYLNGDPVLISPRHVLRRVLALYEEIGIQPLVAPKMEFYFVQRNTNSDYPLQPPAGRSGRREISRRAYSIDAVNEFDPVFEDMYAYCEAEKLDIDTLTHEEGSGQMEINFEHGDPLELADQVFFFKRTLREVAMAHGMYGTFMAKPMADEPGSAMHIHQSLVNITTGGNVFADAHDNPSAMFYQFIAGLQRYLSSALALLAPNVNSYRRLLADKSNASGPINTEWGYDNRTVGLRVPHTDRRGMRVENRLAGADVNSYLAIAASLACGYLGIRERLEPRTPVDDSAYARGHKLPSDLGRALEALNACEPLKTLLGKRFVETYIAVKRTEELAHFKVVSSWEREYLLLRV